MESFESNNFIILMALLNRNDIKTFEISIIFRIKNNALILRYRNTFLLFSKLLDTFNILLSEKNFTTLVRLK